MLRDSSFPSRVREQWSKTALQQQFDGFDSYRLELFALLLGLTALALIPASAFLWRYMRAWWAGIISMTATLAAAVTVDALWYGNEYPRTTAAAILGLCLVIAAEYWRQNAPPFYESVQQLKLTIPVHNPNTTARYKRDVLPAGDPIQDWEDDIIGRAAIVEILADHALRLRTPIVAMHGGLGDGKSSVLNLLRKAIEGQAIVVSFSAWLPGSDKTLATDLFGDIASECRKVVYVPQLRKRALAFARTVSGSVSYLGGFKEILSAQSQREEVDELCETVARVPKPIVVLLDEVDRMQQDELRVLLKILRGAPSIPNLTFVCAFSEEEIKRELSNNGALSYDYLEKFFPVTINLASPDPDMLGSLFQEKLRRGLAEQGWFPKQEDEKRFAELLERVWDESLCWVCTNLRKTGLLLNDVLTAARPVKGEVNPFDLSIIETVRRFYPEVYRMIRTNQLCLTYPRSDWTKHRFFAEERKKADSKEFFPRLQATIERSHEAGAVQAMLTSVFPDYIPNKGKGFSRSIARPTNEEIAQAEKRICDSDYFPIYFRPAVPAEMFSNAELNRLTTDLEKASSEADVQIVFSEVLDSIPPKHPKREDFLWKLGRTVQQLDDVAAERLAYAAASRATDYAYDIMNIGEAARALNIIFVAAQKLCSNAGAQRLLLGAMSRASDDTFARRILEYTKNPERNKILVDFSHVNPQELEEAFIERMRGRYGRIGQKLPNIAQGDWWAFRAWAANSAEDRAMAHAFWRKYIGGNRKRVAQAINFIYPANFAWDRDPRPIVDELFPVEEVARLLRELPEDEQLDQTEAAALERFQALLEGRHQGPEPLMQT